MTRGTPLRWAPLAALGLALALPTLVVVAIGAPLAARRAALVERIAAADDQIARLGQTLAAPVSAPAPRAPAWAALDQPTPTLAAAAMQSRLDAMVEAAGGERRAAQTLDPRPAAAGALRVGVTLDATFSAEALSDFLRAVETARPLMVVETLDAQREAGSVVDDPDEGAVALRAVIHAFAPAPSGGGGAP